jgi:hypothetical protein
VNDLQTPANVKCTKSKIARPTPLQLQDTLDFFTKGIFPPESRRVLRHKR